MTTPAKRRSPRGVGVHWTRRLDRRDVTVRHGIRVTTLFRTLVDLAEVASPDELEEAIRAAERLHRLDRAGLTPIPGRHGTRRLTARRPLVRGHLEPVFLRIVEEAGFNRPETNVPVAGYVVDALWRDARVAIEVDDFDTHRHRDAFERDRVRDRILTIAGLTPVRVTHADLTDGRGRLIDHLRALGIR